MGVILAVFAHHIAGPGAGQSVMRGMCAGLVGFGVFFHALSQTLTRVCIPLAEGDLGKTIVKLPKVKIRLDATPKEFNPGRFLAARVARLLGVTPVTMHKDARRHRAEPVAE